MFRIWKIEILNLFEIWKLEFGIYSSCGRVVGERSWGGEALDVSRGGAPRSENAGMSSEIPVKNRDAECPRFPSQR